MMASRMRQAHSEGGKYNGKECMKYSESRKAKGGEFLKLKRTPLVTGSAGQSPTGPSHGFFSQAVRRADRWEATERRNTGEEIKGGRREK